MASRGLQQSIEQLAHLHTRLDNMLQAEPTAENQLAITAAMAIYATGRDATTGRVRPPFASMNDTDVELIPEYRDAAYYASVAYAGGNPTDPISDADRRRQFWSWYLAEAVPAAYSAPI